MARITFDGYGLTELRGCARELKIKGRSKMTGEQLLAACRAGWDANRKALEDAVLAVLTPRPGTLVTLLCGCVIRSTTDVLAWAPYGALYVHGEYVSICGSHRRGYGHHAGPSTNQNDLDYINRDSTGASGYPAHKYMIYNLSPSTTAVVDGLEIDAQPSMSVGAFEV